MATSPFDLNRSLEAWRRQFGASAVIRTENLDEMEAHLRESTTALVRQGLTEEEAFLIASRRVGPNDALEAEFAKVHPGDVWRTRAVWMLAGVFLFVMMNDLASLASGTAVLLGNLWNIDGLRLGWLGTLASGLVLSVATLGFIRVVFGRGTTSTGFPNRSLIKPAPLAAAMIGAWIVLRLAAVAVPILLAREISATGLGGVYAVLSWGEVVGRFVFLAVLAVAFVRLTAKLVVPTRPLTAWVIAALLISPAAEIRTQAQTAKPLAAEAKTSQRPSLDRAMKFWQAGNKDDALKEFVAVDFTQRPLFPKGSVLAYSEKEFMALPRAVSEKIAPQILTEIRPLKGLALHVKEAAVTAQTQGDQGKADKYLLQLKRCGEALGHPDSLAILRTFEKVFTRLSANPASPTAASAP
jgi:hypothetical protein